MAELTIKLTLTLTGVNKPLVSSLGSESLVHMSSCTGEDRGSINTGTIGKSICKTSPLVFVNNRQDLYILILFLCYLR